MAFFEDLVFTEDGAAVPVVYIGATSHYVVDDQGFRRHIDARTVDRVVLGQFMAQLQEHQDEAAAAMLSMMGQDDLFSKAIVDSTLRNMDLEKVLNQGLPPDARQWLGLLGLRVIVDLHGEVVRVDLPAVAADDDK